MVMGLFKESCLCCEQVAHASRQNKERLATIITPIINSKDKGNDDNEEEDEEKEQKQGDFSQLIKPSIQRQDHTRRMNVSRHHTQ